MAATRFPWVKPYDKTVLKYGILAQKHSKDSPLPKGTELIHDFYD